MEPFHLFELSTLEEAFSTESLFIWQTRDKKNKRDRFVIGIIHIDEDGEESILPLAALFNEDDDPFEEYDFDFYAEKDISFQEKKPWWRFW